MVPLATSSTAAEACRCRGSDQMRQARLTQPCPPRAQRLVRADAFTCQPGLTRADIGRQRCGGLANSQLPESSAVVPYRSAWHDARPSRGAWPLASRRPLRRASTSGIARRRRRSTRSCATTSRRCTGRSTTGRSRCGFRSTPARNWRHTRQGLSHLKTSEVGAVLESTVRRIER
jgi:hypothetical protein